MKKNFFLGIVLSIFTIFNVCAQSGTPRTFENAAPEGMKNVLALDAKLKVSDNELVIYYVRPDANYADWALWIWAAPGGDGGASWPFTQNWKVQDGIGYMRFKKDGSSTGGNALVSSDGTVGLIVRQKNEWIKDGKDDRLWNTKVSNKIVIFSKDQTTYAASDYKPSFKSAELSSIKQIKLKLSGKYGLDTDGGDSNFVVVNSKGKEYKIAKVFNTNSPSDLTVNMTTDVTIELAEEIDIADSLIVKNSLFMGDANVNSSKIAIEIADSMVPDSSLELGCNYSEGKATFNLWAPTSSSATLNLYKKATNKTADYKVPMTKDVKTGVWSVTYSEVDCDGMFYDYTLENSKGTVTVLDPYAKSMACYKGNGGSGRAAIVDLNSEKAGVQNAEYVDLVKREDAVIYEISVRDFTISPDANVKAMPGTYKAFIEKIPYLKELGITHVQLLPVVNFYNNDESNKKYEDSGNVNGNNYNWGYDPHNYFTPEGWYATDPEDPYCRIRELRELIDECHKAGIGVLLDVVYNHMAGTQFLDDIVPGYYFRTNNRGGFTSNSGCGNDTATERTMMKRIVVDSTSHWVKNYKVDGFRFDLMGLMEASSVVDSYNACKKINSSTLFEGEGWKMYNGPKGTFGLDQNYMLKTNDIAVFNDEFRDLMKAGGFNETGRGFITKKSTDNMRMFANVTGSPISNYRTDDPGDNLNYLVCHDGLTLHDAITHNLRLDEEKDINEIVSRIKLGNFIVMTSQGISFLHGGQERGRTKPNINKSRNESIGNFVRNSYDSADNINQFIWNLKPEYEEVLSYTKGLIDIRKEFEVFRVGDAKKIKKNFKDLEIQDDEGLVFGYTVKKMDGTWIVLINGKMQSTKINVGVFMNNGVIYIDSKQANKNGIENPVGVNISGKSVTLDPLTATVIRVK